MKKLSVKVPNFIKVSIMGEDYYRVRFPMQFGQMNNALHDKNEGMLRQRYIEEIEKRVTPLYEDSPVLDLIKNGIVLVNNAKNNASVLFINNEYLFIPFENMLIYQLNEENLQKWVEYLYQYLYEEQAKYMLEIMNKILDVYNLSLRCSPLAEEEAEKINTENVKYITFVETPVFREFLLNTNTAHSIATYIYLVLKEITEYKQPISMSNILELKKIDIQTGMEIANISLPDECVEILSIYANHYHKADEDLLFTREKSGKSITLFEISRTMRNALFVCGLPTNIAFEEHIRGVAKRQTARRISRELSQENAEKDIKTKEELIEFMDELNIKKSQKQRLLAYIDYVEKMRSVNDENSDV